MNEIQSTIEVYDLKMYVQSHSYIKFHLVRFMNN